MEQEYTHLDNLSDERFSDRVFEICAINATQRTKGVIRLLPKGVKVVQGKEGVTFDIYVILKYGTKIPTAAWDIQENVKKEVENVTEATVKSVNIHVKRIELQEEK